MRPSVAPGARVVAALVLLAAALAVPSASADDVLTENEAPRAWLVELAPGSGAKEAFRRAADAAGVTVRERYAYDGVWSGVSVAVDARDAAVLPKLDGVRAVHPVVTLSLPESDGVAEADLASAVAMTGADVAQSELGLTGEGVKVGVIDSGVDVDHPDLGGCFGSGCRVAYGYDFVGDDYDASPGDATYQPVPHPDPLPDDCAGHGTHVAGIIGANGSASTGARGVAPGVTLGAYRVLGCSGSTSSDAILAALERAKADGMHVVNISMSSAFLSWPEYPTAVAAARLVADGVVVVTSAGNSGANGLYASGAPAVADGVLATASFENTFTNARTLSVNGGRRIPYLAMESTPAPASGVAGELVWVGRGCPAGPAAPGAPPLPVADPYLASPSGKIALIERGACTFEQKVQRAYAAGATGVILFGQTNAQGLFLASGITPAGGRFAVTVARPDGLALRDAAGTRTLTFHDGVALVPNPLGGRVSTFSSFGPSATLTLKPDLGAPGSLIRSTFPLEPGGHYTLGGTSMAAPHVAGAAALLLEARPLTPAGAVASLLRNTADPRACSCAVAGLDPTHRQGAGMLDVDDAITSRVVVEPGALSLGEGMGATRTLTVANSGDSAATFSLSHEPANATGANTFAPAFLSTLGSRASFGAASVTVPAGGVATVGVTISPDPSLPERSVYGGYLVLRDAAAGRTLRVPYSGFKGDYQAIRVLTGSPVLPTLARATGAGFAPVSGGTFTLAGDAQIPHVLLHFDHPARRLEIEVVRAEDGKPVHPVFSRAHEQDFLARSGTATAFTAIPWGGTRLHDNGKGNGDRRKLVPDGRYRLVVRVLKALGDAGDPAHWERWESPTFTVDRP